MMDLVNSNDQVEYLFHHLFLPPKPPGGDDSSASKTIFLPEFVLQSLQRFTVELPGEDEATVQPAISMLQTMRDTMDSKGFLDGVGVRKVLTALSLHNPAALFHVAAQNAGLLIRRLENSFYFETFELSPTNAAAMATKGRLDFRSEEFQEVLANTLVKMSYQRVAEAQSKARKARKDHHEDRETTNPQIVNELMTSFLRGVGIQVQVEGIRKNTREETSYNSSKLPWRRSPAWMLIRVGLHLTMSRLSGGSDDLYKRFMTYLMSQALLKANQAPVSSELLHIMMTKISHRLCKLKGLRDDKWFATVHNIVLVASKTLNERWERICNHSEEQLDITLLALTEMKDHLFFSLPQVDKFLTSISHRGNNNDTANFRPVAHVSSFNADSFPFVRMPHDMLYIPFSLAMIESWVQQNLDQWIENHIHEETACASLKVLLESYHSAAKVFYSSRPEGASRMILTIGEIWVAADKAALHNYPMLKEYDAEVPTKIWQALLLQSKADMARLQHLERCLMERKGISNRPSVFYSFGESMSFPVRYFQSSSMLQSKKTMIEERAELDKQAKIREFYQLKGRYQDLMQQYNATTCGYVYETTLGVRYLIYDPYCHRCPLKSQANNLKIMVHEWPLPTDTLKAQATVFELGIPHQFAEWRDVTFYIIHDVLAFKSFGECPDTFYSLDSYSALSPWRTSRPSRVHLLSEAKPHLETHRRENDISFSDVADAYVQNGLVYQYHDRTSGRFISPFTQSMAVSELCTFKLPDRAQALNPFLVHTWLQPDGETPNQVIAIQDTADDTQRKEFFESTLDIAMICLQTFNVDDKYLKEILRDLKQASLFVEPSIVINNTTVANNKSQSSLRRIMEYRTQHTLHRTRSILVDEVIIWGNECLNLAIKRSWSDFSGTTEWSLASTTCYWLETMSGLRQVDLNVLTGELLVNGAPLARLPRDYSMHEDYGKLFGSMILDVRPSDVPGMRFSATRPFLGNTVHFGMQGQDLLVHLNRTEPMLDLVPSRLLKGTVPNQLADNFAHWYHRKSKIIEFHKLHSRWAPDDKRNWRFTQDDGNWKLGRDDDVFLVAPSSELGKRIAMILDPLEAPLGLHLVYDTVKRVTEIRIPNLRLEFLLKSGDSLIESRQFRDMHIDSDQSTGTLVGFKSKLVLTSSREPASRTVLIPEGDVRYEMKTFDHLNKHTMVTVVHGSARRVQAYKLDDLLGRLVGSTRTESRLYLAYLHGLTSFCLPDPFIGRTGTEEALDILRSAVVRVPSILTEISYTILDRIASLSPTRSFYPKKEKLMQVVEWSSRLSYMSQNDRFYKAVLDILARCREICFLYPKNEVPDSPDHSVLHLVERAITRASIGHVSGFGAEEFTAEDDVTYIPRAQGSMSARAIRAQEIAFRVYNTHCYVIERIKPSFADDFYQRLGAVHVVNARQVPHKSDMQYDSRWLQGTENFLSSDWCQIHYAFQKKRDWLNKFELMAWVATTSYSKHYDPQITQVLLMMAQSASVSAVPLPTEPSYDLSQGYVTVPEEIRRLAESAARPIASCPESSLSPLPNETPRQLLNRRKQQFEPNRNRAIRSFNDQVCNQWPCAVPNTPRESKVDTYLRCKDAMEQLYPKWSSWYNNLRFKHYLQEISACLGEVPIQGLKLHLQPESVTAISQDRPLGFISIEDLFCRPVAQYIFCPIPTLNIPLQMVNMDRGTVNKLIDIIDNLDIQAKFPYEHCYLDELRQSLSSLTERAENELDINHPESLGHLLRKNLERHKNHATAVYRNLLRVITGTNLTRKDGTLVPQLMQCILKDSAYLPRITPLLLLQQLRPSSFSCLHDTWKLTIIQYATSITAVQRGKRLIRFRSSPADLLRELQNPGHKTWEDRDHPEWLLLECESEIMIRNVQQQVAQKMISPPENKNAVMQLNMGEGKSTVIVPMVATALANGFKIIRVIVAKPQAKQMHQILVSKLAGLLDRPVYLLPFSRDIQMNVQRADSIHRLVNNCMAEGGVLMAQPEHLLSLQLMELECHLSSCKGAAERLRAIRGLFDHASRDIVDESDKNFSVKFELIYTLEQQCSIEDSPSRWVVIQEVLGLVAQFAGKAKSQFSTSLEFDYRNDGEYPIVRFLQTDAGEVVLNRVASQICKTGIYGFPISHQPERFKKAVHRYITQWELTPTEVEVIERSRFFDGASIGRILLLRGLFAGGILAFALGQKRWRVNYGIDPHRQSGTKLAVPFRAKDSPTPRSEFSHPDVVITLTCLSYYYGGLDEESLFSAFRLLTKSDNARTEYHEWTRTAPTLPSSFKTLEGVNLRDRAQFKEEIYPHLRYSKLAIDYYLSHLVFSKEAKEFPHKLSASGWDLAKIKDHPTTGFSGTNDSRYVLPTDIKQLDLPE
ncbi:uncharacterized protein FTOL_13087 [Fusarium torulosum]|uniref:ubiquitinyl hydrolase 1 n=1 Tax=Fusarium torulosum TaxID=33205 RepID=A0AAE8ML38_9HYPO|nr:uncharacterized protein FTOL_13087 [Fusarium torulosum]